MPYDPVRDCYIDGTSSPPKRPSPAKPNLDESKESLKARSQQHVQQFDPRPEASKDVPTTHHPNTLLEKKPANEIVSKKDKEKRQANAPSQLQNNGDKVKPTEAKAKEPTEDIKAEKEDGVVKLEQNGTIKSPDAAKVSPKRPRDDSITDANERVKRRKDLQGDVAIVANHYNARPDVGREKRKESSIFHLKAFNNWTKSVLIGKYAGRDARVLDIGCGKGGDLLKWHKARCREYVGVDIAEVSVSQAEGRYRSMRDPKFKASFHALDCYTQDLETVLEKDGMASPEFDLVTMQFCLHYSFETEAKAQMMIKNVSKYLRRGGRFIGTIPNAEQILKQVKNLSTKRKKEAPDAPPSSLSFGNNIYKVEFDAENAENAATEAPPYGLKYTYFLEDAVESVPEWVVQRRTLESIAADVGLHKIYREPFHEIYYAEKDHEHYGPLLERMKVISGRDRISKDEWDAAGVYVAFAFEKR